MIYFLFMLHNKYLLLFDITYVLHLIKPQIISVEGATITSFFLLPFLGMFFVLFCLCLPSSCNVLAHPARDPNDQSEGSPVRLL